MLTESMEDYLEMIYRIVTEKGYVRAVDISQAMHLQASSITKMIQKLDEAGFICYEKYRNISLTSRGRKYGKFLVWRDQTLKEFLQLFTSETYIEEQVEGMEHYVTPNTMKLIYNLMIYFRQNPEALLELNRQNKELPISNKEGFEQLRAWEFRHSLDGET